jgi:hypothetical protein
MCSYVMPAIMRDVAEKMEAILGERQIYMMRLGGIVAADS